MLLPIISNLLYLDGYASLYDKYKDKDRELFKKERHYAYDNYRYYINVCFRNRDFAAMLRLRRAKKNRNYMELFEIEYDVARTYCYITSYEDWIDLE